MRCRRASSVSRPPDAAEAADPAGRTAPSVSLPSVAEAAGGLRDPTGRAE